MRVRTDRNRIRKHTGILLSLEERIFSEVQTGGSPSALKKINGEIKDLIEPLIGIARTSREIDYVLQLSMLYIALSCYWHFRFKEKFSISPDSIKVLANLYYKNTSITVVKPSCHYPGFCAARQPTLKVDRNRETEDEPIGITGLTLFRAEIVHCYGETFATCPTQFNLREVDRSESLVYFPLGKKLNEKIECFLKEQSCSNQEERLSTCCMHRATTGAIPKWVFGTLGVETTEFSIDALGLRHWLKDQDLQSVLIGVSDTVRRYKKARKQYKVQRAWTALDGLRRMRPRRRHALETACFSLSKLCGGADITLHLREFFPDQNREKYKTLKKLDQKRSARLVLGIGPRVRGFLIHERYEGGIVGRILKRQSAGADLLKPEWLNREEIKESLETDEHFRTSDSPAEEPEKHYRALMQGTVLNVAVPVVFASRLIGVVNIEWDEDTAPSLDLEGQAAYVRRITPPLVRAVQYLCLIIDFLDDHDNPRLGAWDDAKRDPLFRRQHQLALRHYATNTLRNLKNFDTDGYLDQAIKNVGYQVNFNSDLRVLASIRRANNSNEGRSSLRIFGKPHGIEPDGDPRAQDLWIDEQDSVLLRTQALKVPIFGKIIETEDGFKLEPDALCLELMPQADRPRMEEFPEYLPAHPPGSFPVYEVGVPLVFGHECLGTFDFTLFSAATGPEEIEDVDFRGRHLLTFLDWARFFSFFIAAREDQENSRLRDLLSLEEKEALKHLLEIVALVLFEVPTDFATVKPVIETYLQSLVPLDNGGIQFVPSENPLSPLASETQQGSGIWLGNQYLGLLKLHFKENEVRRKPVFSRISHRSGIVRKIEEQVKNLIEDFHRPVGDLEDREFIDRMKLVAAAVKSDLSGSIAEPWAKNSPTQYIQDVFRLVHRRLEESLRSASINRYGWFLYLSYFSIKESENESRWYFASGKANERWLSMHTKEADDLVKEVLRENTKSKLREILLRSQKEEVVSSWLHSRFDRPLTEKLILEGIFELLGCREIRHPEENLRFPLHQGSPLSLTRRIASRWEDIQAFPDLNRNPFRSERVSGWFFGDESYALIGMPIAFENVCIGILQIFRRRDHLTDLNFFKGEEIDSLKDLKATIEQNLREQLTLIPALEKPGRVADKKSVGELFRAIEEALAENPRRPLVVHAPFSEDRQFLRELRERFLGGRQIDVFSCIDKRWKEGTLKPHDNAVVFLTCPPLAILNPTGREKLEDLRELGLLKDKIAQLTTECSVVLFCNKGDRAATELLPPHQERKTLSYSEDLQDSVGYLLSNVQQELGDSYQLKGLLVRSDQASSYRLKDLLEPEVDYAFDPERQESLAQRLKHIRLSSRQISPFWVSFGHTSSEL